MSSASLKKDLLKLLSDYEQLLGKLLQGRPHLRGSFHQVYTRCGKPNCWCAKAVKGHPHLRLSWSEAGNFVTRKVPAADKDQVAGLTNNYRQFREQRQRLTSLASQIQECLNQYEKALTQEVRKPLAFLTSSAPLSAKRRRRLQVEGSDKKLTM